MMQVPEGRDGAGAPPEQLARRISAVSLHVKGNLITAISVWDPDRACISGPATLFHAVRPIPTIEVIETAFDHQPFPSERAHRAFSQARFVIACIARMCHALVVRFQGPDLTGKVV